jgi:hypothetical protein
MTYIRPFLRLVFIGTLYTNETFSFSMSLVRGPAGGGVAPVAVPEAVEDAIRGYFATNGMVSSSALVTLIKCNEIGEDGRYANDDVVELELNPPAGGAAATTPAPQVALVVSLRTGVRRGRAHAGRYYLPVPAYTVQSDGRLADSSRDGALAAAVEFVAAINAAFGQEWVVGVTSDIGTGAEHRVEALAIGRVLDTIRSRRNSLDEDYQESALPIVP